jgi:acyl-CoA dehydrogenase
MNLALTSDQLMIRDAAQSVLADASDSPAVRAAMETEAGFDPKIWQRIGGELGWCGTAIPEQYGGLGLGPVELSLILEQMGRHLLCAPFFASVCLAGNVLLQVGSAKAKKAYLPHIADGSLTATAIFDCELKASGTKLSGRALVADGATAGLLLLCAGHKVFAVKRGAAGLSAKPLKTWDGTRRFAQLTLKNVLAERVDDPRQRAGIAKAESLSRLYLAAEQLGGAQQCLDLILHHTTERKQFGRFIASFQAVKHRCAELMVKIEGLRSMVYGAAALAASNPDVETLALECASAKALASDTYFHTAGEAIQLHGGVGFTSEFDPQLYFKRAQASSHWLGAADALRENVAQSLLS